MVIHFYRITDSVLADSALTFILLTQFSLHVGGRKYYKKQTAKSGPVHAASADQ
jgi:hypothetical protein